MIAATPTLADSETPFPRGSALIRHRRPLFLRVAVVTALLPLASVDAQDEQKSKIPADTNIKTTASGLKYSVLVAGKARSNPKPGDKVLVHYTGWFTDGKQFDSSRDRGEAFGFEVGGGVIKGWNEGIQLMTDGARFKFTIPKELGYGDAILIFDVELLAIKRGPPEFKKANVAAQKTTRSGIKYEVLQAGKGEFLQKNQMFKLAYAFWKADGELQRCTENNGNMITGRIANMRSRFLKEAPLLLKLGSRLRFEVPKRLVPNSWGVTIWELELVEISPAFSLSDAWKTKTTKSGLKYEVIKPGTGKSPTADDTVTVHYAGWLTNGTQFDSSYARGETSSFSLSRVISGWTEGIQLMKEGAVFKFTIPGNLAYGPGGSPHGPPAPTDRGAG